MLQFALIGCGRIAGRHAENINGRGKLVAVCDTEKERADSFAATHHARPYYSIDELLRNEPAIDVVVVCTPNGYHAEHCIKSLQAGKHVLCEKPLCLTSAAAWQIVETEKFCRRKLFVVKSNRYNPLLSSIRDHIEKGALGKIYSFHLSCIWHRPDSYYNDWHGTLFPDGGSLYTQFSHYIDAIVWMFGEITQARGFSANAAHKDIIEFDDTGVSSLVMKNGAIGTLHWSVNAFQKNHEIALTIVAEKGTLRLGGPYMNEVQYMDLEDSLLIETAGRLANQYSNYQGSMSNHDQVYAHLFEALENGTADMPNVFDGLRTVEAIEKIYKAYQSS